MTKSRKCRTSCATASRAERSDCRCRATRAITTRRAFTSRPCGRRRRRFSRSEMGTGIIQSGGVRAAELKDGLMARLSEATGRTVIYNNLGQTVREPDAWKKHMARVEETSKAGIRAYPLCSPNRVTQTFTMRNCQVFRGSPTWAPNLLSSDEGKLRAYADPAIRQKLHDEVVEHKVDVPAAGYSREWYNYMWVETPVLEKNQGLKGTPIGQIAKEQNKRVIDAF